MLNEAKRHAVELLSVLHIPGDSPQARPEATPNASCSNLLIQVVGEAGIEPTTPGLEGRCSIQLSYSPTRLLPPAAATTGSLADERSARDLNMRGDAPGRNIAHTIRYLHQYAAANRQ